MSTREVYTAAPVSKLSMNIQIKVPEPKAFYGEKCNAKSWLKNVKRYFIAAGLSEQYDMYNV